MQYEFDQPTLDACGWVEYPGGFLSDPAGTITPKDINPSSIPSSKDKKGLEITVKPRQVAFIFAKNPVSTNGKPILVCLTLRAAGNEAAMALGALKGNLGAFDKVDGSVAYLMPTTAKNYNQQERRMIMQYEPDEGNEATLLFQLASSSKSLSVTVWIDKLEVYSLDDALFSSNSTDLINPTATPTPTPTMTPTPTPTVTPTPKPLETITIPLPNLPANAVPLEMVLIPAGTFTMGSPINELNREADETQHQVTITKPFYIGKYEVTQAQWQTMIGINPSNFKDPNNPVEKVKWTDCLDFITELNKLGLGTFRLPTEAEWEYACRAGTTTAFYWGDDRLGTETTNYAWYSANSGGKTHGVGLKKPNPWGLFDMSGNVWEWCQDIYGSYSTDAQIDPTGANSGSDRVLRGASYLGDASIYYHSASRNSVTPTYNSKGNVGFRVVLERN